MKYLDLYFFSLLLSVSALAQEHTHSAENLASPANSKACQAKDIKCFNPVTPDGGDWTFCSDEKLSGIYSLKKDGSACVVLQRTGMMGADPTCKGQSRTRIFPAAFSPLRPGGNDQIVYISLEGCFENEARISKEDTWKARLVSQDMVTGKATTIRSWDSADKANSSEIIQVSPNLNRMAGAFLRSETPSSSYLRRSQTYFTMPLLGDKKLLMYDFDSQKSFVGQPKGNDPLIGDTHSRYSGSAISLPASREVILAGQNSDNQFLVAVDPTKLDQSRMVFKEGNDFKNSVAQGYFMTSTKQPNSLFGVMRKGNRSKSIYRIPLSGTGAITQITPGGFEVNDCQLNGDQSGFVCGAFYGDMEVKFSVDLDGSNFETISQKKRFTGSMKNPNN